MVGAERVERMKERFPVAMYAHFDFVALPKECFLAAHDARFARGKREFVADKISIVGHQKLRREYPCVWRMGRKRGPLFRPYPLAGRALYGSPHALHTLWCGKVPLAKVIRRLSPRRDYQ